jgi:hypothetical protein
MRCYAGIRNLRSGTRPRGWRLARTRGRGRLAFPGKDNVALRLGEIAFLLHGRISLFFFRFLSFLSALAPSCLLTLESGHGTGRGQSRYDDENDVIGPFCRNRHAFMTAPRHDIRATAVNVEKQLASMLYKGRSNHQRSSQLRAADRENPQHTQKATSTS